jgi:hypothetical protein
VGDVGLAENKVPEEYDMFVVGAIRTTLKPALSVVVIGKPPV